MRAVSPLLALTVVLLTGCGFQLRGLDAVPEALQQVVLQGDTASPIYQALANQLRANGIHLTSDPKQSRYQIRLLEQAFNRRAASLNTRGTSEEYELRTRLTFEIVDHHDQPVTGPVELALERTYRYDENNLNAMQAEEALLRQELREALASQVIRRYLALATDPATP